jgi:hypothetical protein
VAADALTRRDGQNGQTGAGGGNGGNGGNGAAPVLTSQTDGPYPRQPHRPNPSEMEK